MKLRTLKPALATLGTSLPTLQPASWRSGKQTAAQRGYDYRWQQARAAYLREHPLCCFCVRGGRDVIATVVDHIIPHRGDKALFWDRSNWQGLCVPCHSGTKQRQEAAERQRS
ncbi:HNH endonuclease [Bordetella bronchiseptica]|uniref:HNH endonuclease n=1 Tax=Bordetella bronchiseptica TaxID=518 RepID=UPI00046113B9|nr:HNH endonuclease signature motif containing protein [Bordetella bronchiseptica]KDD10022.1 HNH endonuclease domain protein [Bordetella bronchiseptica MBORD707]VEI25159.1 HNH endonuclease [Bordetella bronchiseptica]